MVLCRSASFVSCPYLVDTFAFLTLSEGSKSVVERNWREKLLGKKRGYPKKKKCSNLIWTEGVSI